MSSPTDRAYEPDDPSLYAPKWAGEGGEPELSEAKLDLADDDSQKSGSDPADPPHEGPAKRPATPPRLRSFVPEPPPPPSLEPTIMPDLWPAPRLRFPRLRFGPAG